jgi:hypothetical protein
MHLSIGLLTLLNLVAFSLVYWWLLKWARQGSHSSTAVFGAALYALPLIAFVGPAALFGLCEHLGLPVHTSHGFVSLLMYAALVSFSVAAFLSGHVGKVSGRWSNKMAPNPSIERTPYSRLRRLPGAAHVER